MKPLLSKFEERGIPANTRRDSFMQGSRDFRRWSARVIDGYLRVVASVDPINDAMLTHLSISVGVDGNANTPPFRGPHIDEINVAKKLLFPEIEFAIEAASSSPLVAHLWESVGDAYPRMATSKTATAEIHPFTPEEKLPMLDQAPVDVVTCEWCSQDPCNCDSRPCPKCGEAGRKECREECWPAVCALYGELCEQLDKTEAAIEDAQAASRAEGGDWISIPDAKWQSIRKAITN